MQFLQHKQNWLFFLIIYEKAENNSVFSLMRSSYIWYVPVKWMKNGVEQEQYWLLQKSGTAITRSTYFFMIRGDLITKFIYFFIFLSQCWSDESFRGGLGPGKYKRIRILQGQLRSRQLGSPDQSPQHRPSGLTRASKGFITECRAEGRSLFVCQTLPAINRAQIIDDAFNLAR